MTLHNEEIAQRKFATTWRGYSKREVEAFLGVVAADHSKLLDECRGQGAVPTSDPPAEVLVAIARLAERAARADPTIELHAHRAPFLETLIHGGRGPRLAEAGGS
jgi:DivIVA domain-containing protein